MKYDNIIFAYPAYLYAMRHSYFRPSQAQEAGELLVILRLLYGLDPSDENSAKFDHLTDLMVQQGLTDEEEIAQGREHKEEYLDLLDARFWEQFSGRIK